VTERKREPSDSVISRRDAIKKLGAAAVAVSGSGCIPPREPCAGAIRTQPLLADIEAMVVVMMENRSFDHHLGALRGDSSFPSAGVVDGLRGDESNPDEEGRPVPVWRLAGQPPFEPGHRWDQAHQAFAGGRNDGFVLANDGRERAQVMGYHDRETLPIQYALADQFTVCDRWFSSVMGPTWPNRFCLHATTAEGRRSNRPIGLGGPATIWERMGDRCQETRNYFAGPAPWYAAAFPAKAFSGNDAVVAATLEEFFRDARTGNLPPFSVIDPDFFSNDGHPHHDLALSEIFLSSVYRALADSPQWPRTLLVVTYDEHGGYFDHQPPPLTVDPRPDFRQLGFRVPALVIGPTVWQGRVVSTPFEHVSVAATLRARFGIESLGPRMDATADLSSCIDPARAARPAPPAALPLIQITAAQNRAALAQPTSQRELADAVDGHHVPEWLVDPRSREERLRSWFRHAQELAAVRVTR
jgi:phospholipase C